MTDVQLKVVIRSGTQVSPLAGGWVYRKDGSTITTLHAESDGRLRALRSGGDATKPWEYTAPFTVADGTALELYFSRGVSPLPAGELSGLTSAFRSVTVPPPAAQPAQVGPGGANTVAITPTSTVELTDYVLRFTSPVEPLLFPVLFTLPSDAYQTDGINQGGALWTSTTGSGNLTVTVNAAAAAPSAAVRPTERGHTVTGVVDGAASGVKIRVIDAAGNRVQLRTSSNAAAAQEVAATLASVSGSERTFEAKFSLVDPATHFGSAQIVAVSEGLPSGTAEAAFVLLAGVQCVLVDDFESADAGTQAGPVRGEADDVNIVDFQQSPQPDLPSISAQTRARRMVRYQIRHRARTFPGTTLQRELPEMPLWMGELQLLGVNRASLEGLMQRRKRALTGNPTELGVSFDWELPLAWDGPNSGGATRPFSYNQSFSAQVSARFAIDANEALSDFSATDNSVSSAYSPAPAALAFPVTGRRAPRVFVGVQRAWGRVSGATAADALVLEFQPSISDPQGAELLRGGDGRLLLNSVSVAATPIAAGLDPTAQGFDPAPAAPLLRLPAFRVTGINPPRADIEDLIDTVVERFVAANPTVAGINVLTVAQWQATARAIIEHESVAQSMNQFEHRATGRLGFGGQRFGHETNMPIFGAPAGYGLGQLDNPAPSVSAVFSFLENIRSAVRLLIQEKGAAAFNALGTNFSTPPSQRDRAVFQRETVRRYNGGREFRFQNNTFQIFPQGTSQARINYPNDVLGTNVAYAGVGVAVAFQAADFGPGI